MLQKKYIITIAALLFCFLITWTALADELLVKIDLDDVSRISELATGEFTARFRGNNFLLIQGGEEQITRISLPYIVLDRINQDFSYYLTDDGQQMESRISQLEELGDIVLRSRDTALLRIHRQDEPRLIGLGLPLVILPESVEIYARKSKWMAPRIKSLEEMAIDAEVIGKSIKAVSANSLRNIIFDLQENKDLDPPHKPFRSRYTLRVRETDDPSDDACDNAAEYIYKKFESYGLEVEYDPFSHEVLTQGIYQMRNVVATLPGKGLNSDSVFIVSAHYDSIALRDVNWLLEWKTMDAPGADDNGSGTAGLLEAARILSNYEFDYTIKFVAFSGEELGLHGSTHYTNLAYENGEKIIGVLNLDTIAYDPDVLDVDIIANESSEWIAEAMLSIQREYNIGPLLINKIVNHEMVYSDHSPFWNHGWSAILAIDNSDFDSPEFYPFIHTTEDTMDKLNLDIASRTVKVAVGTVASLADPLGGVPYPDLTISAEDIVLFPKNPDHGESVQVTATIHNVGKADARDVKAQIWLIEPFADAPRLLTEDAIDVFIDDSVQISTSFDLTDWGNVRLLVKTNPDYKVFETNGSNNIASKDIKVGSTSLALGKLMLYPNPVHLGGAQKINIAYSLSKDASIQLDIYSVSGSLIYRTDFAIGTPGGQFGPNNDMEWDGTNSSGEKIASGIYFCHIVAADEYDTVSISGKFAIIR